MGHIVGCRTFETWNYFGCNANELSSIQILNMDVSLQQQWTKTQALNVNAPWGPLYTESRQPCSNAGTPDQLGIATHIWSDLLGVLRDQKATHRSDIAWCRRHVTDTQCKWALTIFPDTSDVYNCDCAYFSDVECRIGAGWIPRGGSERRARGTVRIGATGLSDGRHPHPWCKGQWKIQFKFKYTLNIPAFYKVLKNYCLCTQHYQFL